jgi:hypothetical protein
MKAGEYMKVNSGEFSMKGGVTDTLFGLIGRTSGQSDQKTLGGLVTCSPSGSVPSALKKGRVAMGTEKHIGGPNKTMSAHMGQVPYAGRFLTKKGAKL